jgi:hypothetical protein
MEENLTALLDTVLANKEAQDDKATREALVAWAEEATRVLKALLLVNPQAK